MTATFVGDFSVCYIYYNGADWDALVTRVSCRSLVAYLAAADLFTKDHLESAKNQQLMKAAQYYYVSVSHPPPTHSEFWARNDAGTLNLKPD